MVDTAQTSIDLDTLSDEEFLKLDPSTLQPFSPPEGDSNDPAELTSAASESQSDDASTGSEDKTQVEQPESKPEESEAAPNAAPMQQTSSAADSTAKPTAAQISAKPAPGSESKDEDPKPEAKKPEDNAVIQAAALDFYNKVTAPFKADGKDLQIRSPEDAVRLMQMGVNYSRRMQEMKPLRAQNEMLKAQGLDDPVKLNFMIDVMKGKPEAIQKLLKDSKIDPIDIDVSKDVPYKPDNYQVDPKTMAFREAIETTLAAEGGSELIKEINSSWDDTSKEALRDQPAIFQNLLDQKKSGVYVKIKKELDYQRTMGFLTDVPFVQAYHQVGEAMQKAGVFGPNLTPKPKTQVQSQVQPLDTGTRKAAQIPVAPAPNLSSTQQPRATPSNGGSQTSQPDYWAMSDEDFLKLKPPS
jgi:hypothetical protein